MLYEVRINNAKVRGALEMLPYGWLLDAAKDMDTLLDKVEYQERFHKDTAKTLAHVVDFAYGMDLSVKELYKRKPDVALRRLLLLSNGLKQSVKELIKED